MSFLREFEFTVTDEFDSRDIKSILKAYFGLSEHMITRLKKGDAITLNGEKEYVIRKVKTGDVLKITLPEEKSENIVPNDIPIDVLYEDEDILAVNKPAGMPTHPSIKHFEGTLANAVMHYYRDIPFTFRAVTRLDRDTSGVVIIAKNAVAQDKLSRQMQTGEFKKEYIAAIIGVPKEKSGRIDAPIKREKDGIIKRCVSPDGKRAVSDYEILEEKCGMSLVRLVPHTGRTHQLRLHLSHIGTPIYADFLYGEDVEGERIRLHAKKVNFMHPFSGRAMEIIAPPPDDMDIENIVNTKNS